MSTGKKTMFRERVAQAIRARPKLKNESTWSEMAGLHRTSLNRAIVRSELDGREGVPQMEDPSMAALAAVAQVDRTWLSTGEGSMDMTLAAAAPLDLHATRVEAAEMLQHGHGLTEEQAWILMKYAAPEVVSVKAFYLEGVRLLREKQTPEPPPDPPTPPEPALPRSKPAELSTKLQKGQPVPKRRASDRTNS